MGQLIDSNFEFVQSRDSDDLNQSMIVGLKFARVDHPDYPSSMDQSVRDLYQNLNPKVKVNPGSTKAKGQKAPKRGKIKSKVKEQNSHLSHVDKMLLAEVGPRGKGRIGEVTQLIEQGADVNARDDQGYSPLYNGRPILKVKSAICIVVDKSDVIV